MVLALMAMAIWMVQGAVATSTVVHTITTSAKNNLSRDTKSYSDSAIAEARLRLKGKSSTNTNFLGDPTAITTTSTDFYSSPNVNWSGYLLSYTPWQYSKDPDYRAGDTNYIPTASSLMNSAITVNSVQQTFPYWVKMRHKREYDAEQLGHRTTSPHYTDSDGGTGLHTVASPGSVIYYGYLSPTSTTPTEFTLAGSTSWPQVELVTIQTETNGKTQRFQAELARDAGPPLPGAMYSKGNVNFMLTGGATYHVVRGNDNGCSQLNPSRPPVYLKNPATMTGSAGLYTGGAPTSGTIDIDIAGYIQKYKAGATEVTTDQSFVNFGSTSSFVTVYSNTSAPPNLNGLKLDNVNGYGLLLVEGDLILEKTVNWDGLILVTGTLTFNSSTTASGSATADMVRVRGGILAGNVVGMKDQFNVNYYSCFIAKAMATKGTKLLTWRRL